ncbi:MAG: hypothetical protein UV20_C0009G0052 [Candidatus Magasanikbacteria bacterium GW2011_GWA2_42_32]|uniref:Uncharacterized protein n=1 Tax=Candidatus Magasanikbacteria bacterium GW2011_GWA2_42_32 TaxID=1619039 RepID=A0A0G1D3J4_9BACT|nr:MAG: hypothetical protein UV20_C0009G0052 [Candidatus Magasanikbacteria bacterium GW2011_GWA2_42_32]HBX15872.1 hypothetical protein [Candidatus Magasanikbacteria bacterium]
MSEPIIKISQTQRLYELLSDGEPHRTDEIVNRIYGPGLSLSRVGARIWDIKKRFDVEVEGWTDENNRTLYWYQMPRRPQRMDFTIRQIDLTNAFQAALL